MKLTVLLVVIGFQVLVFQFFAVRLSGLLPDYLIGTRELPQETTTAIARYRNHIGRVRWWIGVALLALLGLAALDLGGLVQRKLVVAGVSLISAGVFLAGYVRDRLCVQRLAREVPAPGVRTASLERATLSAHYRVAWEFLPPVVWVATLVVTGVAMRAGGTGLAWLAALQTVVVIGGLLFSVRYARFGPRLRQTARAHLGSAETALQLDRGLRTLELRALLGARLGIVLLLAVELAKRALPVLGFAVPAALTLIEWGLVGGLLALFAQYVAGLPGHRPPGASTGRAHA
jgi:hypothetical protein